MHKAKVTGKRQITIPIEICDKLNIVTGNQVAFIVNDDKIVFQKLETEEDNLCPICNATVFIASNLVNFEGRRYHMECWFNQTK